jgi:hypothetical protein
VSEAVIKKTDFATWSKPRINILCWLQTMRSCLKLL